MSSKTRYPLELTVRDPLERALREAGVDDGEAELVLELAETIPTESAEKAAGILANLISASQERELKLQKRAAAGQLGAGIVHEVRNILAGIRGFSQVALGPNADDAKRMKLFSRVEAETTRCIETVTRFLQFSRDPTGGNERIDVNVLLREAAELLAPHIRTRRLRIKTTLSEHEYFVRGNPGELLQVLVNLGLNAQHAMPTGGELELMSTSSADDMVSLVVNDTGTGVPEELREKIFEPFFTTGVEAGTGLGLALCRQIASAHGGTLNVLSSTGGASFELRLPVFRDDGSLKPKAG